MRAGVVPVCLACRNSLSWLKTCSISSDKPGTGKYARREIRSVTTTFSDQNIAPLHMHTVCLNFLYVWHLSLTMRNMEGEEQMRFGNMSILPLYMGKMGSICHFSRVLPASIWGHCSQVLVFASTSGTQKRCDNEIFHAVFPSIWTS